MANDAYLVKQDITLPRAISLQEELPDGTKVYNEESINYGAGDYVLSENVSPSVMEMVTGGELGDFLEPADRDEAEAAMREGTFGTFIAEHSAEAYILDQYGHTVVPREQAVEVSAAGNEGASAFMEKVKGDELDVRDLPGLPEDEVPEDQVPAERPPGVQVGEALAEAAGSGEAPPAPPSPPTARRARRTRPGAKPETTGAEQAPVQPPSSGGGARQRPPSEK